MQVTVFSSKQYTIEKFTEAVKGKDINFVFEETRLNRRTAKLAEGSQAVCIFVNDKADKETIKVLAKIGVKFIALRCAGFNNVDLLAAEAANITVVRVPAYSPHAVAEHTVALMLTLNRMIHRAYNRVREGNFELQGLLGFDMQGKTAAIIGCGKIGLIVGKILQGLGMQVLAYDKYPSKDAQVAGFKFVDLQDVWQQADVISLHCPLLSDTKYLINEKTIAQMKKGVMLVNTSRGGLVDSLSVIEGLKSGQIGYLALDVYEDEENYFFDDKSSEIIQDDVLMRLTTFPNVIITGHQAFFTHEALENISATTIENLLTLKAAQKCENEIRTKK